MMNLVGTSYTRVEQHTSAAVNHKIKVRTGGEIAYYAEHPEEIDRRLEELEREWDTERWLQLNSGILSLVGLGLGIVRDRRWLLLTASVQAFFLQHGIQGWCPPLPLFRRLGVRTMREIERERNALKALRGDFARAAGGADSSKAVEAATRSSSDGRARKGVVTPTRCRVRNHTPRAINERLDREMSRRVAYYAAHPEQAGRRLQELDREWDIERVIEVEAPLVTLAGLAMGAAGRRGMLGLSLFAQSMMVAHAVKGFYPLIPVFRAMGLRTVEEIAAERYAIKAILGDFERVQRELQSVSKASRAEAAFEAAMPSRISAID